MTDTLFLVYALFAGMLIYSAVAISMFITYLVLNKNNNFGDLFSEYGENPYDQRSHRYPEHLLRRRENGTTE